MSETIYLGKLFGLNLSAKRNALVWAIVLWLILGGIAYFVLGFSFFESVIGGLLGVVLHYISELIHQVGHAGAARRTGYSMVGIRFWTLLAASIYPKDEPPLPGRIHIRRALGGPTISFVVSILALLLVLVAQNFGGLFYWLAFWFFLDNLFVFTLGALLPLSFTDGGTLVRYWGKP